MRFVADAQADEVIARLFEEGCAGQMGKMMGAISSNDEEISKGLPDYVQEYFTRTATLPPWADRKLMEKGAMFLNIRLTIFILC